MNHNNEHECGCEHTHEEENQYNKYEDALSKYQTNLKDDEIAEKTARLIEKHLEENNTKEVKKFLFNCIDLTTLKCTDSDTSVMKFTEKVNEFVARYPALKNVAAICVYPNMAEIVNDTLEADDVIIACVSGGFPSSQTFIEVKVAETAMAIHSGADEIDIVISVGKFLSGDYEGMCDEIEELKEKNNSLSQEVQNAQHQREELARENNHLKDQQNGWQERLQALLGRMEEV